MENQMSNQDMAYHILEVKYVKAMGREVSIDPRVNRDLYPSNWFSNENFILKSQILAEAIKKKCLIVETESYLKIEEGIKNRDYEGDER